LKEAIMTYRGKVKNGVVVLEGPGLLPEGAPVSVRVLKAPPQRTAAGPKRKNTLYEGLKPFIGMGKGLPPDASRNVDHYLYGTPKRK
jgi:hypothetical protein